LAKLKKSIRPVCDTARLGLDIFAHILVYLYVFGELIPLNCCLNPTEIKVLLRKNSNH
jgi:hypothetical protein